MYVYFSYQITVRYIPNLCKATLGAVVNKPPVIWAKFAASAIFSFKFMQQFRCAASDIPLRISLNVTGCFGLS